MDKKFKVGDKVKVVHSNCYGGADEGKVGKISTILSGSYRYEVDFGKSYSFTHHGKDHANSHYRYYREYELELVADTTSSTKTKYKPGDVVEVRSNLNMRAYYRMYDGSNAMQCTSQMLSKAGRKVRIKSVTKTGKYTIEGSIFPWTDEMFVDKADEKSTCKFKVGDHVVAKKEAPYGITCDGWKGVVEMLKPKYSGYDSQCITISGFVVDPKWFDLDEEYHNTWKIVIEGKGDVTTATYTAKGESTTAQVKRFSEDEPSVRKAVDAVVNKLLPEAEQIVTVKFKHSGKNYTYLTKEKDAYSVGDFVVVPVGKDNRETTVEVVKVEDFKKSKLSIPLSKMKYVIRKGEWKFDHNFRIGDLVEVVVSDGCAPVGVRGHVIGYLGTYFLGVDFHVEYPWTHDCGRLSSDTGRWIHHTTLRKVG